MRGCWWAPRGLCLFGCVVVPLRVFRRKRQGCRVRHYVDYEDEMWSSGEMWSSVAGGNLFACANNRPKADNVIKEQSHPWTVVPPPPGPPPPPIAASQPPAVQSVNVNPSCGLEEMIKKKELTPVTI